MTTTNVNHDLHYPGPDVKGQPTWFSRGHDIPTGWERRLRDGGSWRTDRDTISLDHWYQIRPNPDPEPTSYLWSGGEHYVVTWAVAKNLPRDKWQRLDLFGGWKPFPIEGHPPLDDKAVLRIRRKPAQPKVSPPLSEDLPSTFDQKLWSVITDAVRPDTLDLVTTQKVRDAVLRFLDEEGR